MQITHRRGVTRLRMTDLRPRVFLSSTQKDLVAERAVVFETLRDRYHVVRMEQFGSESRESWEKCAAEIVSCDGYIVLLGHKYGSILADSGFSYTQAEHELAQIAGLATFGYVKVGIDDALPHADDPVRLRDFYQLLMESHTIRHPLFRDLTELPEQVRTDLEKWKGGKGTRPMFHKKRRAIADLTKYAAAELRHELLAKDGISACIADLAVADAQAYPEHRQRRLGNKALEVARQLEAKGVPTRLLNQVPVWAAGGEATLRERASAASVEDDLIICLVQGTGDAERLALFDGHTGLLGVWHPQWLESPHAPFASVRRTYSSSDLQDCSLANDIEKFIAAFVERRLTTTAAANVA
jgi:hypothetical protein